MPNFNAFMHRRNIFRKELDFKRLACDYQELKPFMTVGSKNKLKFQFKNPDALRALTCALLHRYFQKRIILPPDRLIPAVPQRLNYICWLEDLVKLNEILQPDTNVIGVDIGTGASCIFPILACHRNPTWSFLGIEVDAKSFNIASENVRKNFMDDRIRVVKISTDDSLNDIICLSNQPITFIMCNPPFFEEEYGITLEMNPNIAHGGGRPKSTANTSDKMESVVTGGEITFVGRMLEESRHLKEEVTIYSSMLGRKQSLTHFKQTLSSLNEENLSWTWAELCQGKTIRYAIAWTFKPGLDLTRAPPLRHGKNKSWKFKLLRKMPRKDCQLELLEVSELIKNLVTRELFIPKAVVTRQTPQTFEMLIKGNERTWTHQRRKRREQQLNKHKHQATSSSSIAFNSCSKVAELNALSAMSSVISGSDSGNQMICDSDSSNTKDAAGLHQVGSAGSGLNQVLKSCIGGDSEDRDQNCVDMTTEHPQVEGLTLTTSRKRKNPSSCSSSPSRICPSPNDELTDDDHSTEPSEHEDPNDDSMNELVEIKRICIKDADDGENMDDIYDYLVCCRVSLARVCHDIYFELKLEHPCTAAADAYDLFQYFRNKLSEK